MREQDRTPTTSVGEDTKTSPVGFQAGRLAGPLAGPLSFAGVLAARETIAAALPTTPAWNYALLDRRVGTTVVLKHENAQPTGAFKVRGGLALLASFEQLPVGLVTASTGNHAQSIASAARTYRIPAMVVMPVGSPPVKADAVAALGAEVVSFGETMTEAVVRARELSEQLGWYYVDPGGEPAIVHGHATTSLELLEQYPDLETLYVPIGSGTGAAGACLVRDGLASDCRIVGVQSAQAPAAYDAWKAGAPRTAPCHTRASGLATGASFDLPQSVLVDRLDDFLLVDDDAIDEARMLLATHAHTLAESAGAAALAGLLVDPHRPERCGVIVSGGNADARELATLVP